MTVFKSSKITWSIMTGDPKCHDWLTDYCADGDGIVQVVVYTDRIELLDQMEVCNTWAIDFDICEILEKAQLYIAATYPQIYVDAKHREHTPSN